MPRRSPWRPAFIGPGDQTLRNTTTNEIDVLGVDIDAQTRCAHWHSDLDVIAIKFKCCGEFYACFDCHQELSGHVPEVWSRDERAERAILCGACKAVLSIDEYLACASACPVCGAAFNPGCAKHYHLYFE